MKNPFKSTLPKPIEPTLAIAAASSKETGGGSVSGGHAFGQSINHVKPFMTAALQNFTLVAPVLLIAAIALSVMAVIQASTFISTFTRQVKTKEISRLSPLVEKKPLVPADYQSAANIIAKNNSAVTVSLPRARTSIIISIKEPALLPEFMYALVTIQSYRSGVAWSAGKLCLNKCDGGAAATVEITGYTQAISFSGLRPK